MPETRAETPLLIGFVDLTRFFVHEGVSADVPSFITHDAQAVDVCVDPVVQSGKV